MADTRVPRGSHVPPHVPGAEPGTVALDAHAAHAVHRGAFLRHLVEMVVAMWVGMVVGGLLWAPILGAMGMTPTEARLRYPEVYLLVMGFNMTVPMVAWMRHRGHGWRACFEMTAAMVLPGILILAAYWLGVSDGPACGLYCGLMIPAMAVAMLFRRDEYGL